MEVTSDKAGKNEWNSLEPPSSLEEDIRLLFICDLGRFHLWSQQQNKDSLLGTSSGRTDDQMRIHMTCLLQSMLKGMMKMMKSFAMVPLKTL